MCPQPQLLDSTTYHPLRPTTLDKTKNLRVEVQSLAIGVQMDTTETYLEMPEKSKARRCGTEY